MRSITDFWTTWLPPQTCNLDYIIKCAEKWKKYIKIRPKISIFNSPKHLSGGLRKNINAYTNVHSQKDFWYYCHSFNKITAINSYVPNNFCSRHLSDTMGSTLRNMMIHSNSPGIFSSSLMDQNTHTFLDFVTANLNFLLRKNEPTLPDRRVLNMGKHLIDSVYKGFGISLISDIFFFIIPIPRYFLNNENIVHKDLAPAIIWADGEKEYYLNGVRVPEIIALTPREKLEAKELLLERNVEIRREIVKKIGIEKVCKDLNAKCIDKKGNYELLLLTIGLEDNRHRPYLKMINPSTGTYHIEGIRPDISKVEEALNWRNQTNEKPEILT